MGAGVSRLMVTCVCTGVPRTGLEESKGCCRQGAQLLAAGADVHPKASTAIRACGVGCVALCVARQKVDEIVKWSESHEEMRLCALLFLFSYTYLLRLPSEALPAIAGQDGREQGSNAVLFKEGASLVLVLHRRKNKPNGSRLVRRCSCRHSAGACAYHLLGPVVDATPAGARVFGNITSSGAQPCAACGSMRGMQYWQGPWRHCG